jgi:arginyl-tRNA synthetase
MTPSLSAWLSEAWSTLSTEPLLARAWQVCPRPELGDLSHAGAMMNAKAHRCAPMVLAQRWLEALPPHPWVENVSIAPPGHLNIRLSDAGWAAFLEEGACPRDMPNQLPPTLVEFVSANPTGPLHLGHARQAILGDVLVRLLRRQNGEVASEFFYNDAGVQIDTLMQSFDLRVQQAQGAKLRFERQGATSASLAPGEVLFTKNLYHGTYLRTLAKEWLSHGRVEGSKKAFVIARIQAEQQGDLAAMGVAFDNTVSERSLFESGQVAGVLKALAPYSYQSVLPRTSSQRPSNAKASVPTDPVWYFSSSNWGDDQDRVTMKADGSVTYFVPDIAYHTDKWQRGWQRAINIQGSDHHGTLARVKAGVQACCPEAGPAYPQVIFHTMIEVVQNGHPVKASKRAGGYITARELVDKLGLDAFRLSMLDKKPDTPMAIDVDVWLAQGMKNPVYQGQYAHARVCSALDKVATTPAGELSVPAWTPSERRLLTQLFVQPSKLDAAAMDLDPVRAAHLWRDLGSLLHEMYQTAPKLVLLDETSRAPRVKLFELTKAALQAGGQLLGVTCPERMPARPEEELPAVSPAYVRLAVAKV